MFDTRTVRPQDWAGDPWSGDIVSQGPYPKVLMGRGSMGAKRPYVAWLNALASIIAVEGTLPINIMFLAEGEEILCSPSYQDFVLRYRDRLAQVDASFCPSSTQGPTGAVSIGLGLKGMVVVELTASGASWGFGPKRTIHSASGALVDSPPFRLAAALATLVDAEGRGCAVAGLQELWAYRKPLTQEEMDLLTKIASQAHNKDWRNVLPLGGVDNVAHVKLSPDDCETWSHSQVIEAGPSGYSDLAQAQDGAVLCIDEDGMVDRMTDTRYASVARFDLDWITGGEVG